MNKDVQKYADFFSNNGVNLKNLVDTGRKVHAGGKRTVPTAIKSTCKLASVLKDRTTGNEFSVPDGYQNQLTTYVAPVIVAPPAPVVPLTPKELLEKAIELINSAAGMLSFEVVGSTLVAASPTETYHPDEGDDEGYNGNFYDEDEEQSEYNAQPTKNWGILTLNSGASGRILTVNSGNSNNFKKLTVMPSDSDKGGFFIRISSYQNRAIVNITNYPDVKSKEPNFSSENEAMVYAEENFCA